MRSWSKCMIFSRRWKSSISVGPAVAGLQRVVGVRAAAGPARWSGSRCPAPGTLLDRGARIGGADRSATRRPLAPLLITLRLALIGPGPLRSRHLISLSLVRATDRFPPRTVPNVEIWNSSSPFASRVLPRLPTPGALSRAGGNQSATFADWLQPSQPQGRHSVGEPSCTPRRVRTNREICTPAAPTRVAPGSTTGAWQAAARVDPLLGHSGFDRNSGSIDRALRRQHVVRGGALRSRHLRRARLWHRSPPARFPHRRICRRGTDDRCAPARPHPLGPHPRSAVLRPALRPWPMGRLRPTWHERIAAPDARRPDALSVLPRHDRSARRRDQLPRARRGRVRHRRRGGAHAVPQPPGAHARVPPRVRRLHRVLRRRPRAVRPRPRRGRRRAIEPRRRSPRRVPARAPTS